MATNDLLSRYKKQKKEEASLDISSDNSTSESPFTLSKYREMKKNNQVNYDTQIVNGWFNNADKYMTSVSEKTSSQPNYNWVNDQSSFYSDNFSDLLSQSNYVRTYINSLKGTEQYDSLQKQLDSYNENLRNYKDYLSVLKDFASKFADDEHYNNAIKNIENSETELEKSSKYAAYVSGGKSFDDKKISDFLSNPDNISNPKDFASGLQNLDNGNGTLKYWETQDRLRDVKNVDTVPTKDQFVQYQEDSDFLFNQEMEGKYKNKSGLTEYDYDKLVKAYDSTDDYREKEWLKNKYRLVATSEQLQQEYDKLYADYSNKNTGVYGYESSYSNLTNEEKEELSDLKKSIDEKKSDEDKNISRATYRNYAKQNDFADNSKYIFPDSDNDNFRDPYLIGFDPNSIDDIYNAVNYTDYAKSVGINSKSIPLTWDDVKGLVSTSQGWKYECLNDEEKKTFNYIYNTEGKDEAQKYLDFLEQTLNQRMTENMTGNAEKFAKENPIGAKVLSYATNLGSGQGIAEDFVNLISGNEIDTNSASHIAAQTTDSMRNSANDELFGEGYSIQKWVSQVVDSVVDSAISMYIGGKVGLGAGAANGVAKEEVRSTIGDVTSFIVGSQVATRGVIEAKQSGLSDNQAVTLGLIKGIIEGATEKYSVETILNDPTKLLSKVIKNDLARSFVSEGSEEVASNWLGRIAEQIIAQDKSQVSQRMNELKSLGLSDADALSQVIFECVQEDTSSFLAGGISGFAMSGTAKALGYTDKKVTENKVGKAVKENENVNSLIETAKKLSTESKAYKVAAQLEEQQKNNKKVSSSKVGQLRSLIIEQSQSEFDTEYKKVTENLHEDEKAVVDKLLNREALSENEVKILNDNDVLKNSIADVQKKFNNLYSSTETANKAPFKSIKSIDDNTDKIDESKLKVSEDGKTKVNDEVYDGAMEVVRTNPFAETVTYKMEQNGEVVEVNSENIEFRTKEEAKLNALASKYDVQTAQKFFDLYESGQDVDEYSREFNIYQNYGRLAVPLDSEKLNVGYLLDNDQKRGAYEAGLTSRKSYYQEQNILSSNAKNSKYYAYTKGKFNASAIKGIQLDETQRAFYNFFREFALRTGINVELFSSKEKSGKYQGEQGSWNKNTKTIRVDINAGLMSVADRKEIKHGMLNTFSHELTHIAEHSGFYDELHEAIVSALEKRGTDFNKLVEKKKEQLRSNPKTKPMSDEELTYLADVEVIANNCETMLKNSKIFEDIAQGNPTLAQKIKDKLKNFIARLKQLLNKTNALTHEGKLLEECVTEFENINRIWDKTVTDGIKTANAMHAEQKNNIADDSDVENSVRNTKDITWGEQINNYFSKNGLIKHSDTLVVEKNTPDYLLQYVDNLPLALPIRVISKAQSKKDISHSVNTSAIKKIQSGIRNAVATIYNEGRNSILFITDIKQGEYPLVVAFEINSVFDGDSVHKCTSIHLRTNLASYLANLNGTTVFVKNKNELNALCREVNILDRLQKNNRLIDVSLSQGNEDVKNESEDNTEYQSRTADIDNAYLEAVNNNDLETAQKLVDEAAKENGYTIKAYHGTTNQQEKSTWNDKMKWYDTEYKHFTVFKRQYDEQAGHFFNDDIDNAGGYGSILYSVYLKINKPLVIDCKGQNYASITFDGKEMDTYEWAEYAKKHRYDGVIFKNISDGVGYDDLSRLTTDYVVFDSNQIKSSEPITYDDKGNVIPLSKRFINYFVDIRYQSRDTDIDENIEDLLFDEEFYKPFENEDRTVITESLSELQTKLENMNDDNSTWEEQFAIRTKIKALKEGYKSPYDYFVGKQKKNILKDYEYDPEKYKEKFKKKLEKKAKEESLKNDIANTTPHKRAQYYIIQKTNPMWDDYHLGIRSPKDIKTFQEVVDEGEGFEWGDFDLDDAKKALKKGTIRVYSSYAIKNGTFVSTSYQQALEYAGMNPQNVHSRVVALDSVAWINGDEGQYAKVYKSDFDDSKHSDLLFQMRPDNGFANRRLLANALEKSAQNNYEKNKVKLYKENIDQIDELEKQLDRVNEKIKAISSVKAAERNKIQRTELMKLNNVKKILQDKIVRKDKQLLNFESMDVMKKLIESEKKKAYDKARLDYKVKLKESQEKHNAELASVKERDRERIAEVRESKDKIIVAEREKRKTMVKGVREARDKKEIIRKIKKKLKDIDKLLNRSKADKTVKQGLRDTASKLLSLKDILFDTNLSNADIVRRGVETATPEEQKLLKEYLSIIGDTDTELSEAQRRKVYQLNSKLKDLFIRERERLNRATVKQALTELSETYKSVENAPEAYLRNSFDKNIIEAIDNFKEEIGGTLVKNMNVEQVQKLHDIVTMIFTSIRNANKLFAEDTKLTCEETSNNVMNEILNVKGTKEIRNLLANKILDFQWRNLKPIYAFRLMGSKTFEKIYWNLQKGELDWYIDLAKAKQFKEECEEKYGYKSFDFKKTFEFTAMDGSTFTLDLNQMMDIYAASRRPQALQHLLKGGFTFEKDSADGKLKVKTGAKAYPLTMSTIQSIANGLSENEKGYAEAMQKYLSEVMAKKGNEVSMALYGVEMFNEDTYWSISSSDTFLKVEENETTGEFKVKNSGFTKSTIRNASNPIVLRGFEENWCNHVNQMSLYHAMTLPLEDFTKVFNYNTGVRTSEENPTAVTGVRSVIKGAFGNSAERYLRQFISDLNGGIREASRVGIADNMIALSKKAAVFANFSVFLQQPSAIFRAMSYVNANFFLPEPNKLVRLQNHRKDWEQLKKYAPIAGIKEMGMFDTGTGKGVLEWLSSGKRDSVVKKTQNKIDDVGSWLPAKADEYAWVKLWHAIQRETRARYGLAIGTEENLVKSGERFNEVVHLTQVYDSVFSRSGAMRSSQTFDKMATSFMAEPTTIMNMAVDAVVQLKRNGKSGIRQFAKSTSAILISIFANTLLKSVITAGRDDDEDETYGDKYLQAFCSDLINSVIPLNYYPILRDLLSVIEGYTTERMDMSLVSDFIVSLKKLTKEDGATANNIIDFVSYIANLFGLPMRNVVRDFRAVFNTYHTLTTASKDPITSLEISMPTDYQEAYDKYWKEGYTEEDCESKAATSVKSKIRKKLRSVYLEALKNQDSATVANIRRYMRDSGFYNSLNGVDEVLKGWRKSSDEEEKRAQRAEERK